MENTIFNKVFVYILRMILALVAAGIVVLSIESTSNLMQVDSTLAYYVMFNMIFYAYIRSLWK